MERLQWVWATPPDEQLRQLAAGLGVGQVPPSAELLKQSRARRVWRVPDVAGGLLLKHYVVRPRDAVRARLLPGLAEREYRATESLCRRGVPTTRPLGYADRRESGWLRESWYLARLVVGARTLSEALADAPTGERRRRLALAAMEVVAELHGHPVLHRDLHAGNLLLDGDRLLVIDLHSMWTLPRLTRRLRVANLARLLYSMRGDHSLDDLGVLVKLYADRRGEPVDGLLADVRRAVDRFERDYVRGRAARALRNSSEFIGERLELGRVHRKRCYSPAELRADVAEHEHIVASAAPGLLGSSPTSRITRIDHGELSRIVKEDVRSGLGCVARARLGWGRTRGAWLAARRCDVVGVPTPEALALVERPDGSALLVTRAVIAARTLRDVLTNDPPHGRERGALARAVGHLVGRLSRAGMRHADLSTKNLLVAPGAAAPTRDLRTSPPAGLANVQLIDLDGMLRTAPHADRALVRMLGQLGDVPSGLTRADRRRFALGFRAAAGRELPSWVVSEAAWRTRQRQLRRDGIPRPTA